MSSNANNNAPQNGHINQITSTWLWASFVPSAGEKGWEGDTVSEMVQRSTPRKVDTRPQPMLNPHRPSQVCRFHLAV